MNHPLSKEIGHVILIIGNLPDTLANEPAKARLRIAHKKSKELIGNDWSETRKHQRIALLYGQAAKKVKVVHGQDFVNQTAAKLLDFANAK